MKECVQPAATLAASRHPPQPLHFVRAEDDRYAQSLLRIRQVLTDVPPLEDVATKEPERANLREHRADRQAPVFEQEQVIPSELGRREPIEARTRVLVKRLTI